MIIALAVLLAAFLGVTGYWLTRNGLLEAGTGGGRTPAQRQRDREKETVVYARYGSLWRYDGRKTERITRLPFADENEETVPYLVDWVAFTPDEKTVYFVDMDEEYDGKLFRQKPGADTEPERLASGIITYAVYDEDVFYLKDSGGLYMNGERLMGDVKQLYAVSDDARRILVEDTEGRLFFADTQDPENRERIDRGVVAAGSVRDDLEAFFYVTEDDALYLYETHGGRRLLGDEIAWSFASEDPDRDSLFYSRQTQDGESNLYYYDPEERAEIDLRLSGEDVRDVLQVGVFPKQHILYAVIATADKETQLWRAPVKGERAAWKLVEGDLKQIPWEIVCDDRGRLCYLQDMEELFGGTDDAPFDPDSIDWENFDWEQWDRLLDQNGGSYPEGMVHRDGRALGIYACSLFCAGEDLYTIHDLDIRSETYMISCLDGNRDRVVAEDVYLYRVMPDASLVTLRNYSPRSLSGDLYVTKKKRDKLLDRDVLWFSDAGE